MTQKLLSFALLISVLIVSTSIGRAQDAQPVVVEVDCNAGESIGRALLTPADDLIVNISGICEEDVEIHRDNVTLAGTDPALDGIQGVGGTNVLTVRGATNVRIENLRIPGPSARVFVGQSSNDVSIVSCDLTDTRVEATQSSHLVLEDVYLGTLLVDLGARAYSLGSSMIHAEVLDGGIAYFSGGLMNGPVPSAAAVDIRAVRGTVNLYSAFLDGTLEAHNSTLIMRYSGVNLGVTLTAGSDAQLWESNDIFGPLIVSGFSSVWVSPGGSLYGGIACLPSGDASCDDVQVHGTVQGCAACELSSGSPDPTTFQFEGKISLVPSELSGELSVGDPFSMTYTFNASQPGSHGLFENAVWAVSVTIGALTWTGGPASIQLYNDAPGGGDLYICSTSYVFGPPIAGFDINYVYMSLFDPSGVALPSSDSLPVVPPDPIDVDLSFVELSFGHDFLVRSTIESSMVVESVPATTDP